MSVWQVCDKHKCVIIDTYIRYDLCEKLTFVHNIQLLLYTFTTTG